MGSASFMAALEAPRRDEALAVVRAYVAGKPQPISVPHRVEATWAQL